MCAFYSIVTPFLFFIQFLLQILAWTLQLLQFREWKWHTVVQTLLYMQRAMRGAMNNAKAATKGVTKIRVTSDNIETRKNDDGREWSQYNMANKEIFMKREREWMMQEMRNESVGCNLTERKTYQFGILRLWCCFFFASSPDNEWYSHSRARAHGARIRAKLSKSSTRKMIAEKLHSVAFSSQNFITSATILYLNPWEQLWDMIFECVRDISM